MTSPDTATPARTTGGTVAVSDAVLVRTVREESGRIVAVLTRSLRNFDLAEESVADAVAEALQEWRRRGVPPNPGAWLTQAARHNALDRLRRDATYRRKLALLAEPLPATAVPVDERLPLLFGCCHPSLGADAQLALTLRAVCGLTTGQIARATLSSEATIAQRIVRAKRKIGAAGIPLRIPGATELAPRLDLVLTVVSVMYNEAHLVAGGDASADRDIADDAVWLARVLTRALPDEAEAPGLLSLLLFHHAREDARSVDGRLVLLADQDHSRWDANLLAEARRELEVAAERRRAGRWQLQAAIAACHADAATAADTDWLQVLTLYDVLLVHDRSPIVRLNRAVALAEVEGPEVALLELSTLADTLGGYHLFHAVRADLLRRLGRSEDARAADLTALGLTANEAEQRLLRSRLTADD